MGPGVAEPEADWDVIDVGKRPVSLVQGAAVCHHADSFAMIRGGHIDVAVLGGYEVSRAGDLASWAVDDSASLPRFGRSDLPLVTSPSCLVITACSP
jgi:3-oxoadipate CoA-transferase beta subunit